MNDSRVSTEANANLANLTFTSLKRPDIMLKANKVSKHFTYELLISQHCLTHTTHTCIFS